MEILETGNCEYWGGEKQTRTIEEREREKIIKDVELVMSLCPFYLLLLIFNLSPITAHSLSYQRVSVEMDFRTLVSKQRVYSFLWKDTIFDIKKINLCNLKICCWWISRPRGFCLLGQDNSELKLNSSEYLNGKLNSLIKMQVQKEHAKFWFMTWKYCYDGTCVLMNQPQYYNDQP